MDTIDDVFIKECTMTITKAISSVNICKFDQSRGDAIAKKHVNESRKFPLRL